jgi:hypothetical protein
MQHLIASIASLAVAAHAVLGCCWHHSHSDAEEMRTAAAHAIHAGCAGHRHETSPQENSGKHDDDPSGHDGCNEERCSFICIEKQQQEASPLTLASIFFLSDAPAKVSQQSIGGEFRLAIGDLPPHVPIYLAHQILLI